MVWGELNQRGGGGGELREKIRKDSWYENKTHGYTCYCKLLIKNLLSLTAMSLEVKGLEKIIWTIWLILIETKFFRLNETIP